MNRTERILANQIKMGYWPGYTMAMYPSQFAYSKTDVDFKEIWKDTKEVNLYLHIPFCKSLCPYCGFFTIANNDMSYMDKYIDKLIEQIKFYSNCFREKVNIKSICFGGGTPNYLPVKYYYKIFDVLKSGNFYFDELLEPSMEISPEIIDENYIKELKNVGIRRLSMGVQSLDFNLRNTIKRENNYNLFDLIDIIRKYEMNINIDLMSGLMGQTEESFMNTLKEIVKIKPENISIYPLAGKESSMFENEKHMTNKQKYDLFKVYYDYLLENNYYCESNVKFVLKNQNSTHQQKIYEYNGVETLGIGCAARSYNNYMHYSLENRFNIAQRKQLLDSYINTDFEKMDWYGVVIDVDELKSRFAIYGLFMGHVDMKKYEKLFNSSFMEDFKENIEAILNLELAVKSDNEILLTPKGRIYTDNICQLFWSEKVKKIYKEKE